MSIECANIIAYLSARPSSAPPPRFTRDEIEKFLIGLTESASHILLAQNGLWINEIQTTAAECLSLLRRTTQRSIDDTGGDEHSHFQFLSSDIINASLSGLREKFQRFELFGLGIYGNYKDYQRCLPILEKHARKISSALIIIPTPNENGSDFSFYDPYEQLSQIAEYPERWPGVLLWRKQYLSVFLPIFDADGFLEYYAGVSTQPVENLSRNRKWFSDSVVEPFFFENGRFARYRPSRPTRHRQSVIVHLSDLHCGNADAVRNQRILSAELYKFTKKTHANNQSIRFVITGDLFDNPSETEATQFSTFYQELYRLSENPPIIIPGNHDQRWWGNIGQNLAQIVRLGWSPLFIDNEMRAVFFCFDSSRSANLARGRVTQDQLVDVGSSFATAQGVNPKLDDYVRIALIHHHPFSFETKKETLVQRILEKFGISDERFMRMDDAEEFLAWCARMKIPIILHGHKHVQRHYRSTISTKNRHGIETPDLEIEAIGCGTSLGIDDFPLSYNVLRWSDTSQQWSVEFMSGLSDGSGFSSQRITMHNPVEIWKSKK